MIHPSRQLVLCLPISCVFSSFIPILSRANHPVPHSTFRDITCSLSLVNQSLVPNSLASKTLVTQQRTMDTDGRSEFVSTPSSSPSTPSSPVFDRDLSEICDRFLYCRTSSSANTSAVNLGATANAASAMFSPGVRWLVSGKKCLVLVTGGLGYIGSHVVLELLRAGYGVVVVDDLSNSYLSTLGSVRKLAEEWWQVRGGCMPELHFHRMDYRSIEGMRSLLELYSLPLEDKHDEDEAGSTYGPSRIVATIHFAAFKAVPASIATPLDYYNNNLCGLVSLLGLLDEFGIREFVFSSSATVYGGLSSSDCTALREDEVIHDGEARVAKLVNDDDNAKTASATALSPGTSPYARTKLFAEAVLADLARSSSLLSAAQQEKNNWRITVLRYFNPVGSDPSGLLREAPKGEAPNLWPALGRVMLEQCLLNQKKDQHHHHPHEDNDVEKATGASASTSVPSPFYIFGGDWPTIDGTPVRDFVNVVDVARGHVAALSLEKTDHTLSKQSLQPASYRTINLGSGRPTTVLQVVRMLERVSGTRLPVAVVGRRNGDVGFCVADISKAQRELVGWEPKRSVEESVADLWRAVRRELADMGVDVGVCRAAEPCCGNSEVDAEVEIGVNGTTAAESKVDTEIQMDMGAKVNVEKKGCGVGRSEQLWVMCS